MRIRRVSRGAQVRFRVSELSTVTITLRHGNRIVKRIKPGGTGTVTVGDRRLRPGRYTIQVRAIDVAGNRSQVRTMRIR